MEVIRLSYRSSPEVPDPLLIFERRHLEYVLQEFVEQYEEARQHQVLDQRTPPPSRTGRSFGDRPVRRRDRLGAVLQDYMRQAA